MGHGGCIHKLTTAVLLTEDLDKINSANSGITGASAPQTLWLNEELLAIGSWWRRANHSLVRGVPTGGFPMLSEWPLHTHSHTSSSNLMGYQKRRDDFGRGNLARFGRRKWVGVIIFHCSHINSLSRIKKSVTKTWAYKITRFTMVQPHIAWSLASLSLFCPSPLFSC